MIDVMFVHYTITFRAKNFISAHMAELLALPDLQVCLVHVSQKDG